jgi:hypothetical protein
MTFENHFESSTLTAKTSNPTALQSEYLNDMRPPFKDTKEESKSDEKAEKVKDQSEKNLSENLKEQKGRVDAVQDKYGVSIKEKNGKYEYTLHANGVDTVVASSNDLSKDSMEKAEQQMQNAVTAQKVQLENRYSIRFAGSNDRLNSGYDEQTKKPVSVGAREPRLDELAALQAALKQSEPSNLAEKKDKKLLVFFAAEATGPGRARFEPNHNGDPEHPTDQPAMYIFPKTKGSPPTVADAAQLPPDADGNKKVSLEQILVHEFAHNGQNNTNWKQRSPEEEAHARTLGWVPGKDDEGHQVWYIQGKDGFNYMPDEQGNYRRKDLSGNDVDVAGKQSTKENAYTLSDKKMRETALVRTGTDYIGAHPAEVAAEGTMRFRISAEQRKGLQKDSPQLYEATRKNDQTEIDRTYGTGSDGSPE